MWVSEAGKTPGITHVSQPAVILRKRRPSQREGLPTKDLCILHAARDYGPGHRDEPGTCAYWVTFDYYCLTVVSYRVSILNSVRENDREFPGQGNRRIVAVG
jgi:hypothetical protein